MATGNPTLPAVKISTDGVLKDCASDCQDPAGRPQRVSGQVVCELDALLAQAVNVRGGQALVAETPHVSESHVIHHNVEHIWTIADRGRWH